mmetsp:Transcript_48522/g.155211  ORF Transcript_48522/g.155211 Transcript_48522/m.155211 type:complete len:219 (-) Transcript_48522:19-675(-)
MTAEGTNGTAHGAPKDRQDRKHDKKKGKKRHDEDDLDAVEEHYEHVDKRDRTERCHCETGRTKECHNGEDGQLSVKDAAVAAVCKIRQHVLQVKRARRAAKEAAGAGARLVGLSRRKKSGHPIFFPCIPMEEAEAKGIPQFMSIRPPNTTHGEWERIQRCWRPRGGTEDPVGDGDLPPTGGLELRMEQRELEDGLFVHQGNVERLERGNSILRGEGGG